MNIIPKHYLMKTILSGLLAVCAIASLSAQKGWNWPEDPELQAMAKEKQAYYKIQTQLDDFNGTLNTLNWLYANNPELNPSIYIDGTKTIKTILKEEKDPTRREALMDSLLWMYDQRIKYFDKAHEAVDRKAYDAFKLFYKTRSKYPLLRELYDKAYAVNGNNMSDFNLTPYMTLAKFYHEHKPEEMTAEMVLEIHSRVSDAIAYKMANGGDHAKLKKDQNKADAFLSSLDGVLTCEFIEQNLVPKLEANPNDVNTAKKIFNYSLQAKCADRPYFIQAGDVVYTQQPTLKLAKALGDKYIAGKDYSKAKAYYDKASELAVSHEEHFEVKMGQASAAGKLGAKAKARYYAYEAISLKPEAKEAYNLIGNLYFTSFDECKGGKSKVMDRAVFIAAYDMYDKAGNTAQKEASKAQFPSIKEIFNENYEEGQEVSVGCWINSTVKLARRGEAN